MRNKKLDMVFARVTASYSEVSEAIQRIASKCQRIIVYEHNARVDNIHIHFLIEGNTVSTDTIKNYFKRNGFEPGDKGQNWSFVGATDRGCITYMSKGILDPVFIQGYDDVDITECKESWIDRKKDKYQTKLKYVVRETRDQAKKRKNDLLDEMLSEIVSESDIVRVIIKVLNANNLMVGRYPVREYFDTIRARKFTSSFVDSMEKLCWKDI